MWTLKLPQQLCRLKGVVFALAVLTHVSYSQSLLGLFIADHPEYRMMGGNPFATAAMLSRPLIAGSASNASVRYQFWYDDLYREYRGTSPVSQWYTATHVVDLNLPLSTSELQPVLRMQVLSSRAASALSYQSNERASFDGDQSVVNIQYSMRIAGSFQWGLMVTHSAESPDRLRDIGTELSYSIPHGKVGVWTGTFSSAQSVRLESAQISGMLPLDFREQRIGVSGSYVTESIELVLTGYQGVVFSYPHLSRDNNTRLLPSGESHSGAGQITVRISDRVHLLALVTGNQFGGKARFVSGESPYGRLTELKHDKMSLQGGIRIRSDGGSELIGNVQWQRFRGKVKGYAESWPFVSILTSPISQREHVDGGGSIELMRVHIGAQTPVSPWLKLGGGLNWFRIIPSLSVDSWESIFLGIGERGRKEHHLALRSADGVMLSAGIEISLGPTSLSYAVSQFVPWHLKTADLGTVGVRGPGAVPPEIPLRSSGGQFHYLSTAVRF